MSAAEVVSPEQAAEVRREARAAADEETRVARRIRARLARLLERVPVPALARVRPGYRDDSVPVIAVLEDGRLVFRVGAIDALSDADLDFILVHEAMHLELASHARVRRGGSEVTHRAFNEAHDAVINDRVRALLGRAPPCGGVDVPGSRTALAEALVLRRSNVSAEEGDVRHPTSVEDPYASTGALPSPEDFNQDLLPLAGASDPTRAKIRVSSSELVSLRTMIDIRRRQPKLVAWGRPAGDFVAAPVPALAELTLALADDASAARGGRWGWSRPSRRNERDDLPRRGRLGGVDALHVVLDASGSMLPYFHLAIGLIASTAAAAGVSELFVTQADGDSVSTRSFVPQALTRVHVQGSNRPEIFVVRMPCESCGNYHAWLVGDVPPTDLRPGIARAATVADHVVVLTDGLALADATPGVDVTWVLFGDGFGFEPPSGRVLRAPALEGPH